MKPIAKKSSAKHEAVQPEVNVGLVGHVDHGKTTLTEALTGKWTDTHSEEIKRGITIRLGYADVSVFKCGKCSEPEAYTTTEKCAACGGEAVLQRKISFVDAPGHESLMATMLSGATIMDGALLLIAANEICPQPQTREHLQALEIIGIKNLVIVQSKIDLVTSQMAMKNFEQINEFIKGTPFEHAPVIPISAQKKVNIDALLAAIQEFVPTPHRDATKTPLLFVARSFDINKPGSDPFAMSGGVLGGALKQGILKKGDELEVRPGRKIEKGGKVTWEPLTTKIQELKTGGEDVSEIKPGGSVGVLTSLDPAIVKSDALTGAVVGRKGAMPEVWYELKLEIHLLERVVGAKDKLLVDPIKLGEPLMLNVNSATTAGIVFEIKKDIIAIKLKLPVCAEASSRVTISRLIGQRWRLIGYGLIKK